jgi:hypothetical protein
MPEVRLCIHCRKTIDEISDQYVVTNKDTAKSRIDWLYAHAQCQDTYGDGEVNEIQSRLDESACDYVNTQNEKIQRRVSQIGRAACGDDGQEVVGLKSQVWHRGQAR